LVLRSEFKKQLESEGVWVKTYLNTIISMTPYILGLEKVAQDKNLVKHHCQRVRILGPNWNLDINRRPILKWILKEWSLSLWIECVWFRIRSSDLN
jgi:hypothetical protein